MMTKLIQADFRPDHKRFYQSVFSIGNGKMGQRANFEEDYTGDSIRTSILDELAHVTTKPM